MLSSANESCLVECQPVTSLSIHLPENKPSVSPFLYGSLRKFILKINLPEIIVFVRQKHLHFILPHTEPGKQLKVSLVHDSFRKRDEKTMNFYRVTHC